MHELYIWAFLWKKGIFLEFKVLCLWRHFVCSVSKSVTYQLLKPQLDVVLFEIIFPLMCFNDADDQLWREDPHEYVRKGYGM